MGKRKSMCTERIWHMAVMSWMLMMLFSMFIPLKVSAEEMRTGTLGDNNGITWSYDENEKTLIITGEDSGLQGSYGWGSTFSDICSDVEAIILKDCKLIGNVSYMFAGLDSLKSIECENVDTSNVTDMSGMFMYCGNLSSLDVSGFDTANVTSMWSMFCYCSSLGSLDVSDFDTSKVTNMGSMFAVCSSLSSLDVSGFDTANVTNMNGMFVQCSSLSSLDVRGFDTNSVSNMSYMFFGCSGLSSLDVSRFGTSNATDMNNMFSQCGSLLSLDLGNFDTTNVTDMSSMLYDCSSLDTIHTPKTMADGQSIELPYVFYNPEKNSTSTITKDFCNTILTKEKPELPAIEFKDVKAGAFYEEAVQWALKKGVTTGLTDTTFGPDQVCTRGQIVTFLWRAYGSPEPKALKSQFKDVQDPNAYYYKAVLWAVENGITTGLNATTFDPDGACTRGQVVTFMWRAEGKPSSSVKNPFVDLKAGEYYCEPVLWAVENGITTGLTSTTFGPDETCTRGQIVTFLYRGMK